MHLKNTIRNNRRLNNSLGENVVQMSYVLLLFVVGVVDRVVDSRIVNGCGGDAKFIFRNIVRRQGGVVWK